jgi:hypothetical protein
MSDSLATRVAAATAITAFGLFVAWKLSSAHNKPKPLPGQTDEPGEAQPAATRNVNVPSAEREVRVEQAPTPPEGDAFAAGDGRESTASISVIDEEIVVLELGPERCVRMCQRFVVEERRGDGTVTSVVRPTAHDLTAASPYHPPANFRTMWLRPKRNASDFLQRASADWTLHRYINAA